MKSLPFVVDNQCHGVEETISKGLCGLLESSELSGVHEYSAIIVMRRRPVYDINQSLSKFF
jgi:hypothetical protein